MERSTCYALAGLFFVLAGVSCVYGIWLGIIQTHGDSFINAAGVLILVAVGISVFGRIWGR